MILSKAAHSAPHLLGLRCFHTRQAALETQDWSCTYLAHQELESIITVYSYLSIIIIIIIMIIVVITVVIIITNCYALFAPGAAARLLLLCLCSHQPSQEAGNPDRGEPLVQPPGSGYHHGQLRVPGHCQSPV